MSENFQNFSDSTTAGSLDNSSNPITVNVQTGNGSRFPSANFRITVCNGDASNPEVMFVTTRTSDALTAYRGTAISTYGEQENATPTLSTHSSGSVVSHNITVGGVKQLVYDIRYGDPITTPTLAIFTSTLSSANVGSFAAANDTTSGEQGIFINGLCTSGDTAFVAYLQAVPSTPYHFRARYYLNAMAHQYPMFGICWSDGTKLAVFGNMSRNDWGRIRSTVFSDIQTYNGSYDVEQIWWAGFPSRNGLYDLYGNDDGTNRGCYLICDGLASDKIVFDTRTNTSYFTPTLIGIAFGPGDNFNGNHISAMKLIDFTVGAGA
jgi:hypothetical protein